MYHYLCTIPERTQLVDIEPWLEPNPNYGDKIHPKYTIKCSGGICDSNIDQIIDFYESLPTPELKADFKKDFKQIGHIQDWFFGDFLPSVDYAATEETLNKAHAAIKEKLLPLAKKYNLEYGTD